MTPAPPDSPSPSDHYSYAVYADPAMAARFEGMRFGGPIGRLIAVTQEEQIAAFLAPVGGQRILDVGTGTGRAAIALARRGAAVTGVDASEEMLGVARQRATEEGAEVTFARGDVHALEFPDRSFDAVVCLRVLMHTPDWRRAIAELCRVARTRVVLDYPSRTSAAAIQSSTLHLAAWFAPATEAYRVFSPTVIARELDAHGFRIVGEHRQFVLPIALHKKIGSEAWTRRVEAFLRRVPGVGRLASPITIVAER